MKINRELFLICLISSLCAGKNNVHDPLGIYNGTLQPQTTDEISHLEEIKCQCPGLAEDGVHVFEALGKPHNDLERLVVYLYKDKTNQDLIAYTPNKEKQKILPDLLYTAEDNLQSIGTQSVVEIFESYSNANTAANTEHVQHLRPFDNFLFSTTVNVNKGNIDKNPLQLPNLKLKFPQDYQQVKDTYNHQVDYASGPEQVISYANNGTQTFLDLPEFPVPDPAASDRVYVITKWLDKQVNELKNVDAIDTTHFDLNHLKQHIVQLLLENNFKLNSLYQLTDARGKYVDLRNIKLYPVRRGHTPLNYNGLFSVNDLEGIMLATVNPPKILGVVPLNHLQTLPTISGQSSLLNNKELLQTRVDILRILEVTKWIINVWGHYFDPAIADDLKKRLEKVTQAYTAGLSDGGRKSEVESPWLRIIGGTAALNSGAPLSSKGRAGDMVDFLKSIFA